MLFFFLGKRIVESEGSFTEWKQRKREEERAQELKEEPSDYLKSLFESHNRFPSES